MLLVPDPTGSLRLDNLQQREDHWVIVDLIGKGGHGLMVPVPDWGRKMVDDWLIASADESKFNSCWVNRTVSGLLRHRIYSAVNDRLGIELRADP
jgi:hypothetical protein